MEGGLVGGKGRGIIITVKNEVRERRERNGRKERRRDNVQGKKVKERLVDRNGERKGKKDTIISKREGI